MSDSKHQFNWSLTSDRPQQIIRQGAAPKPREPEAVAINGDITAPAEFYEKSIKAHDRQSVEDHVLINMENRQITLIHRPRIYQEATTVVGVMEMDHRLKHFGINTGQEYNRDQLAKLFRFNRSLFTPQSMAGEIVKKLHDFQIKFQQKLEDNNDQRGNRKLLVERSIKQCDLPETFDLRSAIFKRSTPVTITVDLLFEVASTGDVAFQLESPDLSDYIESQASDEIAKQAEKFGDLPIIYQ